MPLFGADSEEEKNVYAVHSFCSKQIKKFFYPRRDFFSRRFVRLACVNITFIVRWFIPFNAVCAALCFVVVAPNDKYAGWLIIDLRLKST